jgi:hypothetical protein
MRFVDSVIKFAYISLQGCVVLFEAEQRGLVEETAPIDAVRGPAHSARCARYGVLATRETSLFAKTHAERAPGRA